MPSPSYSGGAGIRLQTLVLDGATTPEQKADCLKLLKVVVKNLADPVKAQDPKFRQLKLENAKVQQKLLPFPSALDYLKAVGFSEAEDEQGARLLRIDEVNVLAMQTNLTELSNAIGMVVPNNSTSLAATTTNQKPRSNNLQSAKKMDGQPSSSKPASLSSNLSEKQKARLLMEQKAQKEREAAKKHRAENVAKLEKDKYVRKHDSNWKSGVSAAMAKTGDGISTFRDRHGEN